MNLTSVKDYFEKSGNYNRELIQKLKSGEDSYFDYKMLVEKLKEDYKTYGKIIVAYDFDNTVCPSEPNYRCDNVVALLKLISELKDFEMVCFTARCTTRMVNEARDHLNKLGIRYDTINDDVPRIKETVEHNCPAKILYSVFLDDRCGLGNAYMALVEFVGWYLDQTNIS